MIAGAAGFAAMGGLTWRDAPGILAKVLLVIALSAAVAAVLIFLLKRRGLSPRARERGTIPVVPPTAPLPKDENSSD